jgi:uncharacterized protein with HEPN domain
VSRSWLLYLDDLIAGCEKIGRLVQGRSFEAFRADEAVFDAVLFNLQVIGESVKRLPAEARAAMPEASGSGPARLRDLIAHRYFALDAEIIWEAATVHVPRLLAQARELAASADADPGGLG